VPEGGPETTAVPKLKPRASYDVIADRGIFAPLENQRKDTELGKNEKPSVGLHLRLRGTILASSGTVLAVIQDLRTRQQDLYELGDRVAGAKIVRILKDSAILEAKGERETLALFVGKEGRGRPGGTERTTAYPQLSARFVLGSSQGMGAQARVRFLMAQLRLMPRLWEGKPNGFVVGNVPPGSVFERAGLKTGDLVVAINGDEVRTSIQLLQIYEEVAEDDELWLDVIRDGREETIDVGMP
jgi:general secretion pathway protein C